MKRIISVILALALVLSCVGASALAANTPDARASLILNSYAATLEASNTPKEIIFRFEVYTDTFVDSIGVETIKIYKSNGSFVKTITGTTENGLIVTNDFMYVDSYDCSLASAGSYYAEVTVFAKAGTISDSRTITTGTVTIS